MPTEHKCDICKKVHYIQWDDIRLIKQQEIEIKCEMLGCLGIIYKGKSLFTYKNIKF